jgi:hypothetical protein
MRWEGDAPASTCAPHLARCVDGRRSVLRAIYGVSCILEWPRKIILDRAYGGLIGFRHGRSAAFGGGFAETPEQFDGRCRRRPFRCRGGALPGSFGRPCGGGASCGWRGRRVVGGGGGGWGGGPGGLGGGAAGLPGGRGFCRGDPKTVRANALSVPARAGAWRLAIAEPGRRALRRGGAVGGGRGVPGAARSDRRPAFQEFAHAARAAGGAGRGGRWRNR